MLKAIVYDLDGTLIDSRADLAASVNAALVAMGLPELPLSTLIQFVGGGAEMLVRRSLAAARGAGERAESLNDNLVVNALPHWHAAYAAHLLDETKLYPGLAELIGTQTISQAVLTNKPGNYSRRILEGLGVSRAFRFVVGGDEAPRKPDPRGLLALCEKLEAQPSETLLVGDSHFDVDAGKAAGVSVCAVSWGFDSRAALEEKRPDFLVDGAAELAELLARLAG